MGEIDVSAAKTAFDIASRYSEWSTIAVTAGVFIEFVALFIFSRNMPIFATLLIVAGCGGEFIFGSRANNAAAQLQQASDEKIGGLIKETTRLSLVAETARAAIAQSEAETANANETAAKANERTVELKLALEKEIAARQGRQINPQQHAQLQAALTNIADKGEITVSWKLFDEEAERFGKQILQTLIDSGFVDAKEVRGPFSFGVSGQ
jgi:ABC-type multidrug transport system fused ATPase/permease subunit